jgi:hypothetical protein
MTKLREPNETAEITSYAAVRQEMRIAHMNTIAGRLNGELFLNYEESIRLIQDKTMKRVIRGRLESVMADFGGLSAEEISDERKGFFLLYANLGSRHSTTLMFDGEFFVVRNPAETIRTKERASKRKNKNGQSEFFENLLGELTRARDEIKVLLSAVPNGQLVYIGDCGYYVHHLNPYTATLYSQADMDEFVGIACDLERGIRGNGLPIQQYDLDVKDFREAVTSNPRNEGIIEKVGFTQREPSIPFVPRLNTGSEEFYAVGDRVFLDDDLECLIQAIGNERVWYLDISGMPGGATIPEESKATVTVELQRSFEKQFFNNLRNLELVRRRRHRELLDILAEMNRDGRFTRGGK